MLNLSCHCGQIRVETGRPDFIHECNCTLCAKAGARWGYFHPSEVSVEGTASGYCREDKERSFRGNPILPEVRLDDPFRPDPSAVSRFGNSVMGVNMRLADESDLAGIELRYPDGRAWPGEGAFTYVREARLIGEDAASG